MTAPTKNVVDLATASTLAGTDKVVMVDVSDTTEGPLGTVKIATITSLSAFFDVISAQGLTSVVNNGMVYVNSGGALTSNAGVQFNGSSQSLGAAGNTWGGGFFASQISTSLSDWAASGTSAFRSRNVYYDGSNRRYVFSGTAQEYEQSALGHSWYGAVSGPAGGIISFVPHKNIDASGNWLPGSDNAQNLGSGALRMAVLYAGTGTINTSDATEKTAVVALDAAEIAAAKDLANEIGSFQFLDSVAKKGAENARHHIGMTVQRAIEVMESHGLDPFGYAFICYDEWDAETKEVICDDGEFSREIQRQVVVETPVKYTEIEIINGVPTMVGKTRTDRQPQVEAVAVVDENGAPVIVDGKPLVHPVPVMETVIERYNVVTVREAGSRYGFRPDQLALFMIRGLVA